MEGNNSNSSQETTRGKEPSRRWGSIYTDPLPTVTILMAVLTTLILIVVAISYFNVMNLFDFVRMERERTTAEMRQVVEFERAKFKEMTSELTRAQYSDRVERYTRKLAEGDLGQQTVAIWGLLWLLNEIKTYDPALLDRIAPEYSGAVPYLRLDIAAREFTDSYRGKVWIWVILLESKNVYIKGAINEEIRREPKLTPELLDEIFRHSISELSEEKRKDFQESLKRLKPWIRPPGSEIQGR